MARIEYEPVNAQRRAQYVPISFQLFAEAKDYLPTAQEFTCTLISCIIRMSWQDIESSDGGILERLCPEVS